MEEEGRRRQWRRGGGGDNSRKWQQRRGNAAATEKAAAVPRTEIRREPFGLVGYASYYAKGNGEAGELGCWECEWEGRMPGL